MMRSRASSSPRCCSIDSSAAGAAAIGFVSILGGAGNGRGRLLRGDARQQRHHLVAAITLERLEPGRRRAADGRLRLPLSKDPIEVSRDAQQLCIAVGGQGLGRQDVGLCRDLHHRWSDERQAHDRAQQGECCSPPYATS